MCVSGGGECVWWVCCVCERVVCERGCVSVCVW